MATYEKYEKISLDVQLEKLSQERCVYPEYTPLAIRAWAKMPLSVYLRTENRRKEFRELLGITKEEECTMTYAEAASHIAPWFDDDRNAQRAQKALSLLAEPLYVAYRIWEDKKNGKDAKNTA